MARTSGQCCVAPDLRWAEAARVQGTLDRQAEAAARILWHRNLKIPALARPIPADTALQLVIG
jgi:hypothetical protein